MVTQSKSMQSRGSEGWEYIPGWREWNSSTPNPASLSPLHSSAKHRIVSLFMLMGTTHPSAVRHPQMQMYARTQRCHSMGSERNHSHFTTTISYTPKSQLFWLFKHSSYTAHVHAHTVGAVNIDAETGIDALLTVWGHNNQWENHSVVELPRRPHTDTHARIPLMSSTLMISTTSVPVWNMHKEEALSMIITLHKYTSILSQMYFFLITSEWHFCWPVMSLIMSCLYVFVWFTC